MPLRDPWALLGNLSPSEFMRDYWQKKPLLVRGAIPAFGMSKGLESPISAAELNDLAKHELVESRVIQSHPWRLKHGPQSARGIPKITEKNWTMLIQGMEGWHPAAAKVWSWFRFIPDARLDDLMISIAGIGGGVGPHFDSYDVFLIQMSGRRQWRISEQKDLSLNPNLPLKILQNFKVEQEWVLEPGDMLYLPPHVAHDGIALDHGCQTWSVGFRSPSFKELLQEGLWRLAESLEDIPALADKFADPKQGATYFAEQLPDELIKQLGSKLKELKLDQIDGFLPGITAYLSEPKQQALFDAPEEPLNPKAFIKKLGSSGIISHPQSRILSLGKQVYCNGENMSKGQSLDTTRAWQTLSASKKLKVAKLQGLDKSSLYEAYLAGWVVFDQ